MAECKHKYINSRVFGSDIARPIKRTLLRRQLQTEVPLVSEPIGADNLGDMQYDVSYFDKESAGYTDTQRRSGYGTNHPDKITGATFKEQFYSPGTNYDLSFRKPWARMWTAIRGYYVTDKKKSYGKGNVRIYEVGNNVYDDYNLHSSSNPLPNVNKFPDSFLDHNPFMKPAAGISSIQSTSQGPLGIYWETIINFKVYNYFDYSNIFTKFFLYPGARIFVDFGWDTSNIYDQSTYFTIDGEDASAGENYANFTNDIFAFEDYCGKTDGLIAKSGGSLHVIEGYVTNWTSKTESDGSFNCTITLSSGNKSLIDSDQGSDSKLSKSFTHDISRVITQRFLDKFKLGDTNDPDRKFFDLDFIFRDIEPGKVPEFYKIILERLRTTETETLGTFYDKEASDADFVAHGEKQAEALNNGRLKKEELREQLKTFYLEPKTYLIPEIAEEIGVYYQWLDDSSTESVVNDNTNIYITFEFLEDELLNKNLGMKFQGDEGKVINFDSSNQFMSYSHDIFMLQMWLKSEVGTSLSFLYPTGKRDLYRKHGQIPIRKVFINLEVVMQAFGSTSDIYSAMKQILDNVSSSSEDILKLAIKESGDNILSIIDMNCLSGRLSRIQEQERAIAAGGSVPEVEDNGDDASDNYKFDDLFVFDPYSDKSIVSHMDLSLEMPSNTMGAIIAINATSINNQVYPGSPGILLGLGLKDLHTSSDTIGSGSDGQLHYEWLPGTDDDIADNINEHYLPKRSDFTSADVPSNSGAQSINDLMGNSKINFKSTLDYYSSFFSDENEDAWSAAGDHYIKSGGKMLISDLSAAYDASIKAWGDTNVSGDLTVDNLGSTDGSNGTENDKIHKIECTTVSQYFSKKLKNQQIETMKDNNSPFILPYSLNLSMYGISGISPGNVFRVDYLPSVYVDKIVFIAEQISHNITPDTWTTSIGSYSMYRTDKMFNHVELLYPEITWSPKMLKTKGYSDDQITDFLAKPETAWWDIPPAEILQDEIRRGVSEAPSDPKPPDDIREGRAAMFAVSDTYTYTPVSQGGYDWVNPVDEGAAPAEMNADAPEECNDFGCMDDGNCTLETCGYDSPIPGWASIDYDEYACANDEDNFSRPFHGCRYDPELICLECALCGEGVTEICDCDEDECPSQFCDCIEHFGADDCTPKYCCGLNNCN